MTASWECSWAIARFGLNPIVKTGEYTNTSELHNPCGRANHPAARFVVGSWKPDALLCVGKMFGLPSVQCTNTPGFGLHRQLRLGGTISNH